MVNTVVHTIFSQASFSSLWSLGVSFKFSTRENNFMVQNKYELQVGCCKDAQTLSLQ